MLKFAFDLPRGGASIGADGISGSAFACQHDAARNQRFEICMKVWNFSAFPRESFETRKDLSLPNYLLAVAV